jgi:flagellar M-ring protein FliF
MVDSVIVDDELTQIAASELEELGHEPPAEGVMAGLGSLSIYKQIGLLVGIAASVALGASVLLWTGDPELRPLRPMEAQERYNVIQYFEQEGIYYRMDERGNIMVMKNEYTDIDMRMTVAGIAPEAGKTQDFLNQEQSFGVSQRLEKAKLARQQEIYLSETIQSFTGIKAAKVHLAIPKQNIFVKDRRRPSASVFLNLSNRRTLGDEQVRSIVDLVSGSVPELEANRVTVTDQFGRLYNSGNSTDADSRSRKEFEIEAKRQSMYSNRISEIMEQLVGPGNYSVQVNVDMDFTAKEQTQQKYNPDLPAIRSERVIEDTNSSGGAQGVPGALTNQPPANANIPEVANGQGAGANENVSSKRMEAERNFDLDTTISHTRAQVGVVERISVAVSINYKDDTASLDPTTPAQPATDDADAAETATAAASTPAKVPYKPEELANIERLIKGAIGYNPMRGDLVEVISVPFFDYEAILEVVEPSFYESEWFWTSIKWSVALLSIMTIIFGVFRPAMKRLAEAPKIEIPEEAKEAMMAKVAIEEAQMGFGDDISLTGAFSGLELPAPASDELPQVAKVRSMIGNDPTLVATIVKAWLEVE